MHNILREAADYLLSCKTSSDFEPTAVARLLTHIYVLDIERPATGAPRLRVRLTGGSLDSAFARPLGGQYLESFIHGPRGDQVIQGFHDCANTRQPLWMRQIVQIKDKAPRMVEGIVVYLEPERIYGALLLGTIARETGSSFEREPLSKSSRD